MKLFFAKLSFAAIAAVCVLQASAAAAQDYYVSTTGNDSTGTGTIAQPWATISHASTVIGAGAVVHVAAGTYNGSFNTYASGTASAYITYTASTANFSSNVNCAQVAANHGNLSSCVRLVGANSTTWVNMGDYVTIQGFDVTGAGINGLYSEGNATKFAGNHVHDILTSTCNSTGGSAINLNGTNAQVSGNYVHNIGPYPSSCGFVQGIYFLKAGGSAYNNVTFANSGFGIQLWHEPSHITLVNNTIFNNVGGGIVLGTDDSNFTVDYINVSNNIIANNGGPGVSEQGASSSSTGIHNTYTHNLVSGNSGSDFALQNGLTATSTITSDPNFVNYTGTPSGDYHLQSSSPSVGASISSASPSTDFDGNARSQNGHYDLGGYQYVDASSVALTVSPGSLGFSNTTVGASSPIQTLTLTNQSATAVSLSGITISGTGSADYVQTNTCGSSLSGSCAINVTFRPQTAGTRTATLTISPSSGSVLQVSLSGAAVNAANTSTVALSPSALSFSTTKVGGTSAIKNVTLTNNDTSTLTFSSNFVISGPFAFGGTGTCGLTVAPKASCTISVVYKPTAKGAASGSVTMKDNAGTQTIKLSGSGS